MTTTLIEPLSSTQIAPLGPPKIIPLPDDFAAAAGTLAQLEQELRAHASSPFILEGLANPAAEIERLVTLLRKLPNHSLSLIAWFNLGRLQGFIGNSRAAVCAYDAVLEKKPDFVPAIVNKAVMLEACGEINAGIALLENIGGQPLDVRLACLNQRGRMLEVSGRLSEAEAVLLQSLMLDPGQIDVVHHYTHLRAKQCRWPVLVNLPGLPAQDQQMHMGSLGTTSYIDDPQLHYEVARGWIERKYPKGTIKPIIIDADERIRSRAGGRLRVGFLSSDLRWHAVSILAAEFFDTLDKDRIETFAFDFSKDDGSVLRKRVIGAFEHHVPIHHDSDSIAAGKIADACIDILVDLNGITANARPGILLHKPAPIIISWLGSLTTTGMLEVDYYLTDEVVFSELNRPWFTEEPLFLKTGMHLNSNDRTIAGPLSRAEFGLPEQGFVYCAFINNYKITPEVFTSWMRILKSVPNSVLWVVADNAWSRDNLRREANAEGVAEERLIFAERVHPDLYLARLRLADLFLDTHPYNAGTTAIDCLYVGLPILTFPGCSVPARVAAGILTHADLPELVAKTREDYVQRAITWGRGPNSLASVRTRLAEPGFRETRLFDTKAKARDFEGVLHTVHQEFVRLPTAPPAPSQQGQSRRKPNANGKGAR